MECNHRSFIFKIPSAPIFWKIEKTLRPIVRFVTSLKPIIVMAWDRELTVFESPKYAELAIFNILLTIAWSLLIKAAKSFEEVLSSLAILNIFSIINGKVGNCVLLSRMISTIFLCISTKLLSLLS